MTLFCQIVFLVWAATGVTVNAIRLAAWIDD